MIGTPKDVADTTAVLIDAWKTGKRILCGGAQGSPHRFATYCDMPVAERGDEEPLGQVCPAEYERHHSQEAADAA